MIKQKASTLHDKRIRQFEMNSKNVSGLVGRDINHFKDNIDKISVCDQDTTQELEPWHLHQWGSQTSVEQNTLIGMDKLLEYVWNIFPYHSHCLANIKHLNSCLNNELECMFTELFESVTISLYDKQYFLTKAFMLALMMFTLLWNAFISLRYLENVVKGTTSVDLYVMNVIQVNNVMQSM